MHKRRNPAVGCHGVGETSAFSGWMKFPTGRNSKTHSWYWPSKPSGDMQWQQCSRERSSSLPIVAFGTRSERHGKFRHVPRERALSLSREVLHLSSPKADSRAARTSPGRSQNMKQCASIQRRTSCINTKKDKPMSQQRREQSPRQESNDSRRSLANTNKEETKRDEEASMCSKDVI